MLLEERQELDWESKIKLMPEKKRDKIDEIPGWGKTADLIKKFN